MGIIAFLRMARSRRPLCPGRHEIKFVEIICGVIAAGALAGIRCLAIQECLKSQRAGCCQIVRPVIDDEGFGGIHMASRDVEQIRLAFGFIGAQLRRYEAEITIYERGDIRPGQLLWRPERGVV